MSQVRDITFCKVCPWKGTYLLKHLVCKNTCKNSYTEEEILEFKKSSKAITSKNTAFKKKQKYNSGARAKRYQEEKKKTIGKKQNISIEVKIQSWEVLQKEVADQNMLLKEKAPFVFIFVHKGLKQKLQNVHTHTCHIYALCHFQNG